MIYVIAVTEDNIKFAESLRKDLLKYPEIKHIKIVDNNKKIFEYILSKNLEKTIFLSELTERERTVLSLCGDGLNNKQIAEMLNIEPHTVSNYVNRIVNKLGLKSKFDLDNLV